MKESEGVKGSHGALKGTAGPFFLLDTLLLLLVLELQACALLSFCKTWVSRIRFLRRATVLEGESSHEFAQSQSPGKHNYYDVGAMRFLDNEGNKKTFELFKELGLESKLTEYVMGRDYNIPYYNGQY